MDSDLKYAQELQNHLNNQAINNDQAEDPEDQTDRDHLIALQLQLQLDRELEENNPSDPDLVLVDSDDDDVADVIVAGVIRPQIIIEELGVLIDPVKAMDWLKVDVACKLQDILDRFDRILFQETLQGVVVQWSDALKSQPLKVESDLVLINVNLQLYPRIDLISYLLHAAINLYLQKNDLASTSAPFLAAFRRISEQLNALYRTKVKVNPPPCEEREILARQWYRCTGICSNYSPFRGFYRSETVPGGQCQWWVVHRDDCGGSLFRVYRQTIRTGDQERHEFVVNTKVRAGKVDLKDGGKLIKPQEMVDLTVEEEEKPKMKFLAETIDLDEEEVDQRSNGSCPLAERVKAAIERFHGLKYDGFALPCLICDGIVAKKLYPDHLDGCKGFSQAVRFKRSAKMALYEAGGSGSSSSRKMARF